MITWKSILTQVRSKSIEDISKVTSKATPHINSLKRRSSNVWKAITQEDPSIKRTLTIKAKVKKEESKADKAFNDMTPNELNDYMKETELMYDRAQEALKNQEKS